MKGCSVSVTAYKGLAYLPTMAFSDGFWIEVEPVYTTKLEVEELTATIHKLLKMGHPIFPDLTEEEWKNWHKQRGAVLKATKTRSWKQLAKNAASYSIYLVNEQIMVNMSRLDTKGRWEWDSNKKQVFSHDEPLESVVDLIINDAMSRPDLKLTTDNNV